MRIPSIFQWPSPWLWGAIGVLVLTGADSFFDVIQGAAVVTLIASGVYYLRQRRGDGTVSHEAPVDVEQRLHAIERRLTDTQDVMIALSEKVDAWEARQGAVPQRESTP